MQIMFLVGGAHIQLNKENYPLYLTEVNKKLILEKQIENCQALQPRRFIFCVRADDIKSFQVDSIIRQLLPDSVIVPVIGLTKGAICTALLAMAYINNDEELLILAIDDFIEGSAAVLHDFRAKDSDAGVVAFNSIHPRYSFVKLDDQGKVVEVTEKQPVSKNALASFYYFKQGADFVAAAQEIIRKDNPINGAFYISQTLNELILQQKTVSLYKIANKHFHPMKTEAQLAQYVVEFNEEKDSK